MCCESSHRPELLTVPLVSRTGARRVVAVVMLVVSVYLSPSFTLRAQTAPPVVSLDQETSEALLTLYDTGSFEEFDRRMASITGRLMNPFDFEYEADAWIAASASRERRRLVAAAVSLEIVRILAIAGPLTVDHDRFRLGSARDPFAQMFFELGCTWVRDQPVSDAERQWYRASLVLLRTEARPGPLFGAALAFASSEDELKVTNALSRKLAIERIDALSKEYGALRQDLRRSARHRSPMSRLDSLTPWPQHAKHVAARAPDEPLLLLLPALSVEARNTSLQETLLASRLSPIWLNEDKIDALVSGDRGRVKALSPNTRMDRASAERLRRLISAPRDGAPISDLRIFLGGPPPHAAITSLALWDVVEAFRPLTEREGISSEASMRMGQAYARLGRPEEALEAFSRALQRGATPYEICLTQILRGAVLERLGRRAESIAAFQAALRAMPRVQSASLALAPLLFQVGARAEAVDVMDAAVRAPLVDDPLEYYFLGDPQSSAFELARLRQLLR
jgi:tetratricopeptide (TPR) repeat protein